MDRKLVWNAQLAIARGHRIGVSEQVDELTGESTVLAIADIDTGVRYRRAEEPRDDSIRWFGRVLECTVTFGERSTHTTLLVDPDHAGVSGARSALRGADAAAEAAKAEADRWGSEPEPEPEPERFW